MWHRVKILKRRGRRGYDHMVVAVELPMQSVPITTNIVTSNPAHGEVYNIMWSSLSVTCRRSVVFSGQSGFHHHNITEILWKVVSNASTLILTLLVKYIKIVGRFRPIRLKLNGKRVSTINSDHIGGVMVILLTSVAVYCELDPGQVKSETAKLLLR